MWNKTISVYTLQGKSLNVLIIDIEGIGIKDEDQNYDNKIMTLIILLSSYFIFLIIWELFFIQSLFYIINILLKIFNKKI